MSKLSEDVSVGMLGAAAGLFSSSVALLIDRIDIYYAYLSRLEETAYGTYGTYDSVKELWWVPVSVWHIILSVVASFVVHRYLTIHLRSPFLLWQVVGITSLFGWALTAFLIVSMNCVMHGSLSPLEYVVRLDGALFIAKYVATVSACNVLYGSVMSSSSRQYTEQFEGGI